MPRDSLAYANQVDQVKAFFLYAYSAGDIDRTAAVCRVDRRIIEALEHDFDWKDKIKGINRLDTPEGLKAEQEANRTSNYVMAKRFASLLENVVLDSEKTDRFIETMCIELVPIKDKPGEYEKVFTSKPLVELAKAMQAVQDMTYRALGDKVAAHADAVPKEGQERSTNLAIHIYAGLQKLGATVRGVDHFAPQADIPLRIAETVDAERGVIAGSR